MNMSEALILLGSDSELVTEELADQIDLNWDSGIDRKSVV